MAPLLELVDVHYRYPGSTGWALQGVSIALDPGMILGVLGPNGAGKTTLLKVAALLIQPEKGRVLYQGRDALAHADSLRGRIVYVHEKPVIVRGSVTDNLLLPYRLRGEEPPGRDELVRVARQLGIEGLLGKNARSLSAGERQLVSIARAILARPRVLLLDEPFANLDTRRRRMLASLLRELAKRGRVAVGIVSHDTLTLLNVADRAVLLENGRVTLEGDPTSVLGEYAGSYR